MSTANAWRSPCACTRRSIPTLRASLGSRCRVYDWSTLPGEGQKSGAPPESRASRAPQATGSRARPCPRRPRRPAACRPSRASTTASPSRVEVLGPSASASPRRRPHRHRMAIRAPVAHHGRRAPGALAHQELDLRHVRRSRVDFEPPSPDSLLSLPVARPKRSATAAS